MSEHGLFAPNQENIHNILKRVIIVDERQRLAAGQTTEQWEASPELDEPPVAEQDEKSPAGQEVLPTV